MTVWMLILTMFGSFFFCGLKTWISLDKHNIWIEFYLDIWPVPLTVSLLVCVYIHLLINMCLWMSRLTVCSFSGSLGCDRPHFSVIQFLWHLALHILYCFTSMSFLYLTHSFLICMSLLCSAYKAFCFMTHGHDGHA